MKIFQTISTVVFLTLISFSCESSKSSVENSQEVTEQKQAIAKDINITDFKNLLNENAIILDVRTPEEFNSGHLKNAININYFDKDFIAQVMKLDQSKTLLIHCKSGGRSSGAMSKLKGKGFSTMYNMLGGFSAWKAAGFETIK